MKCISLWEPWASLMYVGAKKNETRSWPTKHRGPLLICAAQHVMNAGSMRYYLEQPAFMKALQPLTRGEDRQVSISDLNFGKALCIVDVVDCLSIGVFAELFVSDQEAAFGNYDFGRFAWVTTNLQRFEEPFKIKGGQRIFNTPNELIERHLPFECLSEWADSAGVEFSVTTGQTL